MGNHRTQWIAEEYKTDKSFFIDAENQMSLYANTSCGFQLNMLIS